MSGHLPYSCKRGVYRHSDPDRKIHQQIVILATNPSAIMSQREASKGLEAIEAFETYHDLFFDNYWLLDRPI